MQSVSENQKILSLKHNWKEFYHKYQITVTIWLLFFLSVAIRSLLANGMKLLSTYDDEILYYGLAENLARNHSFSTYYLPYVRLDRIVYPILIAPAFWAETREVQFLIIAVINAVLLSSGIFPTYLLAKEILENELWALFVGVLYIIMPDMAYAGTFMADLCLLPIALWVFYFAYRMLEWRALSRRERWKYGILFFLMSILACFTKRAGILFLPAFFVAFYFVGLNKKGKKYDAKSKALLIFGMVVFFALMLFLAVKYINIPVLSSIEKIATIVLENPSSYLAYNCYSISQMIIAGGIFPILLPYIYHKQYDKNGKRFFLYIAMVTLLVLLAESYTQASGLYSIHRIHLRYVLFLWMPYFILFLKLFRQEAWELNLRVKVGWGILLTWVASMAFWNHGAKSGSFVDYTMLYFIEHWDRHWSIYFFALGVYVLLIFSFVLGKQWKRVAIVFFALWFAVQGYNNYRATEVISSNYAADKEALAGVETIEAFIKKHHEENFLLLMMYGDDSVSVRRWSDTYLNYPNVKTTFYDSYMRYEKKDGTGYDAEQNPFRVYLNYGGYYDDTQFSYIILPTCTNSYVDESKSKMIDSISGNQFQVYKLDNPSELPAISTFSFIYPGHNYFIINDTQFYSKYEENGEMYFCSQGNESEYVLFGPGCTLPPGSYEVMIYLEDDSGTEEEHIGEADLNSSSVKLIEESISLWSGNQTASFQFTAKEEIEGFETRVWAEVPGVRVIGVDIIYTPLEEK